VTVSQRSCHYLLGDHLCGAVVHTTVKVGVPDHGVVRLCLCFAHRDAGDDALLMAAQARSGRIEGGRSIYPTDIKPGLCIRHRTSNMNARIAVVSDGGVRANLSNGSSVSMTTGVLKRDWRIPGQLTNQKP
jgi:hypothetical protein